MADRALKICWGRGGDLGVLHQNYIEVLKPKTSTHVWSTTSSGSLQNQPDTVFKSTPDRIYIEGSTSRRFGDIGSQFYSYSNGHVLVHSEAKSSIVACHPELHTSSTGDWSSAMKNSIFFGNQLGQIKCVDTQRPSGAARLIHPSSGNIHTEVLNEEALITVNQDSTILLIDLRCRPSHLSTTPPDQEKPPRQPRLNLCVIPDSTNCVLLDSANDQLKFFDWRDSTMLPPGTEVWSLSRSDEKAINNQAGRSTRPQTADSSYMSPSDPVRWRCACLNGPWSICVGSMNIPAMSANGEPVIAEYDLKRRVRTGYLGLSDLRGKSGCISLAASSGGDLAALTCFAKEGIELMATAELLPFFKT